MSDQELNLHSAVNAPRMLPHEIALLKVQLELDAEAIEIDEELLRVLEARKKKKQKPRQVWCKPWLLRRPSLGQYETLMK